MHITRQPKVPNLDRVSFRRGVDVACKQSSDKSFQPKLLRNFSKISIGLEKFQKIGFVRTLTYKNIAHSQVAVHKIAFGEMGHASADVDAESNQFQHRQFVRTVPQESAEIAVLHEG